MKYLSLESIRRIHENLVEAFGGDPGIRDLDALKSAHEEPLQWYADKELHPTIYQKAAALGHGIISNHPFVDGNKRTGATSMILLLEMNDFHFDASNDELVEEVLKIARGETTKKELTEWLKNHTRKAKS